MDGTDYAHIIVVKHRDKEEYQGKYANTKYFTDYFTDFELDDDATFKNTFHRHVFWLCIVISIIMELVAWNSLLSDFFNTLGPFHRTNVGHFVSF